MYLNVSHVYFPNLFHLKAYFAQTPTLTEGASYIVKLNHSAYEGMHPDAIFIINKTVEGITGLLFIP